MPTIQVDIAFLQHLVALLDQVVSSMEEDTPAYRSAVHAAESDWQGQLYHRFHEKYENFRSTSDTALREGQELIQRLHQVITRFELIDQSSSATSIPL